MAAATSTTPLRVARPTIAIAGQDQLALAQGLLGLTVHETIAGLYRCELVVGNWGALDKGGVGFLYFDRKLVDFGKALGVKLDSSSIFDGRISAIEGRFP